MSTRFLCTWAKCVDVCPRKRLVVHAAVHMLKVSTSRNRKLGNTYACGRPHNDALSNYTPNVHIPALVQQDVFHIDVKNTTRKLKPYRIQHIQGVRDRSDSLYPQNIYSKKRAPKLQSVYAIVHFFF